MTTDQFMDWESLYKHSEVEYMPWFTKELDVDLEKELRKRDINQGLFLDLGTGPGTQAIALSKQGFTATGTDISKSAIEKAKKLSKAVEFRQDDILNSKLKNQFDYIFDRGCFHVLAPEERNKYVKKVKSLLNKNGLLFLKCFSVKEKGLTQGPYKFSKKDIEELFSKDFIIENVKETVFHGTLDSFPKAIFVVMKKNI